MKPREGFTLVEVTVGLLLAGLVLSLAFGVFAAVTDATQRLATLRTNEDRGANVRNWLVEIFAGIEVDPGRSAAFDGTAERMAFVSWVRTPDGWTEPQSIEIDGSSGSLLATIGGEDITLVDSTDVAFDYLIDYGAESPWLFQWRSEVITPVAVRIRFATRGPLVRADTVLFLIGDRG